MEVMLVGAAIAGIAIGILSGMLGVGGGVIIVPLLRLGFGLSAFETTGTSLFAIIPTALSGSISNIRRGACMPAMGLALGLGGACLSPFGVWAAQASPPWLVMICVAGVIGYSSFTMFKKAMKAPKTSGFAAAPDDTGEDGASGVQGPAGSAAPAGHQGSVSSQAPASSRAPVGPASSSGSAGLAASSEPAAADGSGVLEGRTQVTSPAKPAKPASAASPAKPASSAKPPITRKRILQGIGIGMITGFASGYVGLGGGFIMVPLMMSLLDIPMRLASGTSLLAVMILAIPGACVQFALGNVSYVVGIALACGTVPGAVIGSHIADRIPERALRFTFAAFLLVAAILLVVKEIA